MVLTILGALFGTVSSQIAGFQANIAWVSGLMGGIFIAIATYFCQEILKPEQECAWVRARSVAEALKSEIFLFRTGTPPYDTPDPTHVLLERVGELLNKVKDLPSVQLSQEQKQEKFPEKKLTVENYLEERLQDQLEHFYLPRAREYEKILKRWRQLSFTIGGLAVILGFLGKWTGAWVAVLTTMGTSVTSYLFANQYQYLIISYQATARQLEFLKNKWMIMGAPVDDLGKSHLFIIDCEKVISVENNAWMANLLDK